MGYREFKPGSNLPALIHANVIQMETPFLRENVAIEKHGRTLDLSCRELMQRLRSFLDRSRAFLPDEDLLLQVCDLSDGLFLLFGTVMCPWLAWLSLLSPNPESASALDKSFLKWSPFAATSVAARLLIFTLLLSPQWLRQSLLAPAHLHCPSGRRAREADYQLSCHVGYS